MKRESKSELLTWCVRHDACEPALDWLRASKTRTAQGAWDACLRGDWLLWLVEARGVPRPVLVLCACDCAERVLKYVAAGEDRPRLAIDAAREWAAGPSEAAGAAAESQIQADMIRLRIKEVP